MTTKKAKHVKHAYHTASEDAAEYATRHLPKDKATIGTKLSEPIDLRVVCAACGNLKFGVCAACGN